MNRRLFMADVVLGVPGLRGRDGAGAAELAAITSNISTLTTAQRFRDEAFSGSYFGITADGTDKGDDVNTAIATISTITSGRGGEINLPSGEIIVNTAIVKPRNMALGLRGRGMGATRSGSRPTALKRTVGTNPILVTQGLAGITLDNVDSGLSLRHMTLDGSGLAGSALLVLDRSQTMEAERVRFWDGRGGAVYARQLFNSAFRFCTFEWCGAVGTNTYAVKLTDTPEGTSSNTVEFFGCNWEANTGGDMWMGGDNSGQYAEIIRVVGGKVERGMTDPNAHAAPIFYIERGHMVDVRGAFVYGGLGPHILQADGIGCHYEGNTHLGAVGDESSDAYATYAVAIQGSIGPTVVMGNDFRYFTQAHVLVEAAVTGDLVLGPNAHAIGSSSEARVIDNRAISYAMTRRRKIVVPFAVSSLADGASAAAAVAVTSFPAFTPVLFTGASVGIPGGVVVDLRPEGVNSVRITVTNHSGSTWNPGVVDFYGVALVDM